MRSVFEEVVEKRFGPVSFVIQGLSILSKAMRSGSRHHAATISRFMLRPVVLVAGAVWMRPLAAQGFLDNENLDQLPENLEIPVTVLGGQTSLCLGS